MTTLRQKSTGNYRFLTAAELARFFDNRDPREWEMIDDKP